MTLLVPIADKQHNIPDMYVEIQVRSALEDIWGEIDHRLRYGSDRGSVGVSWNSHLNVFKVLIDGVVQYVDVIKRQSEEKDPTPPSPTPPSRIKTERSIAGPDKQLQRLHGLPPHILERVKFAFELWKQADASRQRGGHPGLLRQAADAFKEIASDFAGEPRNNQKLAKRLLYVAQTERAYLLTYTGDKADLSAAADLYEDILRWRQDDALALFRLGNVRRLQKQLLEAHDYLRRALDRIERGEDARDRIEQGEDDAGLDTEHWAYDIVRLSLAVTLWRRFEADELSEHVAAALEYARAVVDSPADPANRLRAINDYLYYAWEARRLGKDDRSPIAQQKFRELTLLLKDELELQERSYEYYDTLVRALGAIQMDDAARQAALKLRDMLEKIVILKLKVPNPDLGRKGTSKWMVKLWSHLDADQQDALAEAQDVLDKGARS